MKKTTRNTLPNNAECRRLVAAGDRAAIIDALNYLIDYRVANWGALKANEVRWLDRSIRILNGSL